MGLNQNYLAVIKVVGVGGGEAVCDSVGVVGVGEVVVGGGVGAVVGW